ncbi:hypothetical protein, conserved [Trypanosoma brucei gambiense DAL972]|uniref:Uncharacterized protein n=1 Tax=Trypanosoma brucei gambiense (strain MHOM/CI/86/DAL972) TaxID=679716 RepID=C9ZYC6_TRYB9|nr:hypothetical protein, conserved [Trypanosoma brucei gambiense DAL972]CBH14425.1 hypothetical protein, conserved [Trypanosoma brucei gambiense DAL972]|eukprot:XP_011776691.1 hypothetical protein, conserved [Trypanosoma brucei gambiense DAL972]
MSEDGSDVSVQSFRVGERKKPVTSNVPADCQVNGEQKNGTSRRALREEERRKRKEGHLTDISLDEISVRRGNVYDFYVPGVIFCVRGTYSQFDALEGKARHLLPPLTGDCCQTFSTVAAVTLSSLGFAVMMQDCSDVSTVNYLLYISAWLHQLSAPAWPQQKARPTISDLNTCLRLHEFFPSRVNSDEFEVLFYNQYERAKSLVDQLCRPYLKRSRRTNESNPVCGYVIASGDYTVSIFSLPHDTRNRDDSPYVEAWTLCLCDSHGTQPWAGNKASITSLALGVKRPCATATRGILPKEEGLAHFALILFALLEDHRAMGANVRHTPYMTWSPVRRERMTATSAEELRGIIDNKWLPAVLENEVIARAATKHKFTPRPCFMGFTSSRVEAASIGLAGAGKDGVKA